MSTHRTTAALTALLLGGSLLLSGCTALPSFSTNQPTQASGAPAPARTTSATTGTYTVHVGDEKYKVVQTTYLIASTDDGKVQGSSYSVATVISRAGKTVYTRKIFDDTGWYTLAAKWLVKEPHYKNLQALTSAIKNAT
jgi:hypothetical protein